MKSSRGISLTAFLLEIYRLNFAKTDFDWKFAPNFVLGTSVDFDFYNRFSSVANLSEADFTDTEWTKAAFDMDFSPKAYFAWGIPNPFKKN